MYREGPGLATSCLTPLPAPGKLRSPEDSPRALVVELVDTLS